MFNRKYFDKENLFFNKFNFQEKEKINYLGPHQPSCSVKTQSSNEIKLDKDTILGRGDYGKIFRGEWNNKLVAVKLIKLNKIKKYNQEEELILKRLDHPNVVKFLHIENDSEYRQK
jgi:serine/threonine protein kinase